MFGSYETLSRKERRAAKKFAQEREKTEQCIRRFGWKLCGVRGNYDHFPSSIPSATMNVGYRNC